MIRMVRCEDYQGNILLGIQQILSLTGLEVIDLSAGTGHLSRILAPYVNLMHAFDKSISMLQITKQYLLATGLTNWQCTVANHTHIPLVDEIGDLVIVGWSFSYLAAWGNKKWWFELEAGWKELQHILRPQGRIIFFETMGTGYESPHPPQHLNAYYNWLKEKAFNFTWMRTDYRFSSLTEAEELSGFFFGDEMRKKVVENQ